MLTIRLRSNPSNSSINKEVILTLIIIIRLNEITHFISFFRDRSIYCTTISVGMLSRSRYIRDIVFSSIK